MDALCFWCKLHRHVDALTRVEQPRRDGECEEGGREGGEVGRIPLQQVSTLVGEEERSGGDRVQDNSAQLQGRRRHQVWRCSSYDQLDLVNCVVTVEEEAASKLCLTFKSSPLLITIRE